VTDPRGEISATDSAELKVFVSGRESTCGECNADLGRYAWIYLAGEGWCPNPLGTECDRGRTFPARAKPFPRERPTT
jgi:hypothetical protein